MNSIILLFSLSSFEQRGGGGGGENLSDRFKEIGIKEHLLEKVHKLLQYQKGAFEGKGMKMHL